MVTSRICAAPKWLEREGYTVVRFTNRDVLEHVDGVLRVIVAACLDCPPLTPPVPGGGFALGEYSPDFEVPY